MAIGAQVANLPYTRKLTHLLSLTSYGTGVFWGRKKTGMRFANRYIWMMAASACLLAAQDDPPGRVARLSYTYGSVSFRPLTTGDHVFVDPGGTAELQIGSGVLLLGGKTTMDILNLDDSSVQLRLSEGTLLIRVRSLGDQDSFEVDTPNLSFSLLRAGDYRCEEARAS